MANDTPPPGMIEAVIEKYDEVKAALADLVAAAEPLEMPEKPLKDNGNFIPPEEVLRFPIKHYDAVVFGGAVERARRDINAHSIFI